jgi:hypothetical protein
MPFGSFQRYMPNGTQNGKSLAETRVRVRAHARETDWQFTEPLRK